MKISFSLTSSTPSVSDAEFADSDKSVMPIPSVMPTMPAEVSVMPGSGQEQLGFFEELQSILFSSRFKVQIPEDHTPHSTPSVVSSVAQVGTLTDNGFGSLESL